MSISKRLNECVCPDPLVRPLYHEIECPVWIGRCGKCGGKGYTIRESAHLTGWKAVTVVCKICGGSGTKPSAAVSEPA